MDTVTEPTLDVRSVPPRERHPLVFSAFDALPQGGAFELVADHDPVPLYFQFEELRRGAFAWRYREAGPERWRIRIARIAAAGEGRTRGDCGSGGGCACAGR